MNKLNEFITVTAIILMVWFLTAMLTFAIRHPWATQTECFLNIHRAMMFEKVSYTDIRPINEVNNGSQTNK